MPKIDIGAIYWSLFHPNLRIVRLVGCLYADTRLLWVAKPFIATIILCLKTKFVNDFCLFLAFNIFLIGHWFVDDVVFVANVDDAVCNGFNNFLVV